jgi:hypothetical protein
VRDARAGLTSIAAELAVRSDGLVELAGAVSARGLPPPRLLGPFDPLLLGWTTREPTLGPHDAKVVTGGIFRAFALVRGRGVATWRISRERVELEPFARLRRADAAALEADARDVERFLFTG